MYSTPSMLSLSSKFCCNIIFHQPHCRHYQGQENSVRCQAAPQQQTEVAIGFWHSSAVHSQNKGRSSFCKKRSVELPTVLPFYRLLNRSFHAEDTRSVAKPLCSRDDPTSQLFQRRAVQSSKYAHLALHQDFSLFH